VAEADGSERFVAWFEPDHHILRANAGFFVRRFAAMRWSILTPAGSLHWTAKCWRKGHRRPGSMHPAVIRWKNCGAHYANIFNPARLKVGAMLKEMPRKYWKNMPEAALIPDLIAGAQAREAAMVDLGGRIRPDPATSRSGPRMSACRHWRSAASGSARRARAASGGS
jgi:DNA polymerase